AEDGIRDFHVTGVQTCALPILQLPAIPGRDRAAVSPPFPGPPVDPDDPARLRIAKALRDQPRELLALLRLRQRTRPTTPHRNPRTHRVLRRPLETTPVEPAPVGHPAPHDRIDRFREVFQRITRSPMQSPAANFTAFLYQLFPAHRRLKRSEAHSS